MISITRAQVPSYLTGGEFYNALCVEDDEEFSVPVANFKPTPDVNGIEDVIYLLHTMQFWGVSKLPDALVAYIITKHSPSDYKKLCLLLRDFEPEAKLVELLEALHTLREPRLHSYHKAVHKAILVLMNSLLSSNTTISDQARIVLIEAVQQPVYNAKADIIGHLAATMSEVDDTTSTCSKRNVLHIYTTVYDKGPYPLQSRPLLLRLLFSEDEETVEHSCRALKSIMQCISITERDQFNLAIGERYLELLDSENPYVQWAAVCAVRYFVHPSHGWTGRLIECGLLGKLQKLLCAQDLPQHTLRDTVTTITTCVTAHLPPHLQPLIDAGLLDKLVALHQSGALHELVREEKLLWSYVVRAATDTQMHYLARIELAPVLLEILQCSTESTKSAGSFIVTLEQFLISCKKDQNLWPEVVKKIEECNGKYILETITTDVNSEFCDIARSVRYDLLSKKPRDKQEFCLVIILAVFTGCCAVMIKWCG